MSESLIRSSRYHVMREYPFYSRTLMTVNLIPSNLVPTMAIDEHYNLYYNEQYSSTLTCENLQAVWVHEIYHPMRQHNKRTAALFHAARKGAQADRYKQFSDADLRAMLNIAADLEIWYAMMDDDWARKLPNGCVTPDMFRLPFAVPKDGERLMETIFQKLTEFFEKHPEKLKEFVGVPAHGSGASDVKGAWEIDNDPRRQTMSDAVRESIRVQFANDIMEHARRCYGNIPLGLKRFAESVIQERSFVDYRAELRSVLGRVVSWRRGQGRLSFQAPSRRSYNSVVIPGEIDVTPRIGVVYDTSGSVSDRQDIAKLRGEIDAILRAFGEIDVVTVDAAVQGEKRNVRRVDEVNDIERGGGGTDLRVGLDQLAKSKQRYDAVIVLTDGQTPWPDNPPPFPVVVVTLDEPGPAWSKTIAVRSRK